MSSAETPATYKGGLHRFAVATAATTLLLLVAGALVTSNDAGLAVPDWPLSYGTWLPPMVGNIVYEHGHRLVATLVGLLTTVLAIWLLLKEPRRWVRRLGLVALAAVSLQGILGGLTVLFLLPRPISIAHASLAQIFFCLAVSLAVFTGPGWRAPETRVEDTEQPPLFDLCVATTLVVFVQLILGASYRHSLLGIAPHLAGAAAVAYFVLRTRRRVERRHAAEAALRRPARWLYGLLGAQLLLGAGAYLARWAAATASQPEPSLVVLTVAHVAVGALLLATSVVLSLQAHRLLARPRPAPTLVSAGEKASA